MFYALSTCNKSFYFYTNRGSISRESPCCADTVAQNGQKWKEEEIRGAGAGEEQREG